MILRVLNIIALLFVFSQAYAQDLAPFTNVVYKSVKDAIVAQANGLEVVHLDLKREKIKIVPMEIAQFNHLKSLILDKNSINEIPEWFKNFTELEVLSICNNNLEKFPPVILELSNLRTLKLGDNFISEIPIEIDKLENLESLWLWSNVIREYPASLSDLKKLKYLDLLYNDMTFEEQDWLRELLGDVVIELSEPCSCEFDE
tara:strand:+ start:90 stop:695 length:606 start_codon:yes stop_codon:yes gene_type:complete